MKRDVNLALQQAGPEAAMVEALRPILDSLIAEVARVIDAFTKQYARNIDGVVLTGGGSSMNGLAAYFQSYLHIPVEVGNPWTRIQYPPGYEKMLQAIGPSFATAVGLAMREV
jgi:type IV pilus assembly protein PilM